MSITIDELIRNLADSGLMSRDEIDTIYQDIKARKALRSAEDLARELVRHEHLTKLQAAAVLKGKTGNLVFGDYIVMDKIGSGGMGQVFRARHKPTNKLVALKVLSAEAVKNKRLIARFKKEARAVARLKHPNIVRAYEAGKINRIRYLVMEIVEGENMLARVKRKGPLSIDEVVSCVVQAARGLDYAHGKGIVHRDIKPSNLLRDRRGRVKILDMGLARVDEGEEEDEVRLTMPGQMLGTARFMAPEQVEDARKADVRSDIYSLGCTMYFLLRAKAPYSGETIAHTLMAHVSAPIPDLCKKRSDVPPWLGDVFQKMLAKNPRDRFQTMYELVQVIQKHLGEDMTQHGAHVLDDDDDGDLDEFSKMMAVRHEEGSSLEELYSEAESMSAGSQDEFEPDLPDDPQDSRLGMTADEPARSRFGSRPVDDDHEPDEFDVDGEPEIGEGTIGPGGDNTADDSAAGSRHMASAVSFKLNDLDDEPAPVSTANVTAGAPNADLDTASLQASDTATSQPKPAPVQESGARGSLMARVSSRRAQELAAQRRVQIIAGAVGGVILLGLVIWIAMR